MNESMLTTSIILYFGEWESRKVFHVAMHSTPKKGDLLGLILVGFETRGVGTLHQVCVVHDVARRNIKGKWHITASIKSEFKTPFEHIMGEDCYVVFI